LESNQRKKSNVAESVLGITTRQEKKPWYDDERRRAVERSNEVRIKMIIAVQELMQRSIN
jgi:hypothetical protein